jgi:hypothetical protein
MNHTIKGIIIAVAITSMLIVGTASMVPIMQNSSARSTNINTNTNTATSDSDSTATGSNTNNINNSACTVTVTCPEGSKTVRQTPTPTPTTGTLVITKLCRNSCGPFLIKVTGNNPQPQSVSLTNGQDGSVILGPGNYTVTETPRSGFLSPNFGGDCKRTAPGSHEATGTISAGQNLHCIILNTPQFGQ